MNETIIALYFAGNLIGAFPASPTYAVACEQLMKKLGVERKYIGYSTSPSLHWFSADENKPYKCVPMKPIA